MNEDALRALVREAVARQLGAAGQRPAPPFPVPLTLTADPSHYRYSSLPDSGGPCLIEPTVSCNHCGYCQSHGH
jgi:hypothetical protein